MYAFVTNLGRLLQLNTGIDSPKNNFNTDKRRMIIPLYQREYKWPNDRICGLIQDINSRDKFLGNIIMDELDDHYEIVDGQQRITTCLLILICLYNHFHGSPLEQKSIKQYIMLDSNKPFLENESIGNFIIEEEGALSLLIDDEEDCYYQKKDFYNAYEAIVQLIEAINSKGEIGSFKKKLLDCEFLVLINDRHTNANPVEQVFLDINEKAKLLEPEDIFKGHCFEKYSEEFYQELRGNWVELKKIATCFNRFGFRDLSEYLYLFILETHDETITDNISKNLAIAGKHFLDDKTMDQIAHLLNEMIIFGRSAIRLCENLQIESYRFVDVCPDSERFQSTSDHLVLKRMLSNLLLYSEAKYQKLPVLYFLFKLNYDEDLKQDITHDAFKRIITNLFIYNFVFAFWGTQKKSKKLIDHSIKDVLCSSERSNQAIIDATKELRKKQIENAVFKTEYKKPVLFFVSSVIDFYVSQDNWMMDIYFDDSLCDYNPEHLIIPENRHRHVLWVSKDQSFEMTLSKEFVDNNKKTQANFVVIDRDLNKQLGHKDIVQKISEIEEWFDNRSQSIPNYVQLFIDHIKSCSKYNDLVLLKGKKEEPAIIEAKYLDFLNEYFSEQKQNELNQTIKQSFINTFKNI